MRWILPASLLSLAICACTGEEPSSPVPPPPARTDAEFRDDAVNGMHDSLLRDIKTMHAAVLELQRAAPGDHGWDAKKDATALAAMKDAWVKARTAYEHVEGALAPIFPDIDNSIDARYDDFMTQLEATGGDADLFDDQGVTGMHAVERIIYSDETPARVVAFEKSLPGYVPAAFPTTPEQAASFKNKLCQKLADDVTLMEEQWTPANIDAAIAFQGLIQLVKEQREKVQKASSSEEESRYSQRTMADLRDNLDGARVVYALFQPWIVARGGVPEDRAINDGFDTLDAAYLKVKGASIPTPPASWRAEAPSPADRMSPFGELYTSVEETVDAAREGSVVAEMNAAASLLGFPQIGGAK